MSRGRPAASPDAARLGAMIRRVIIATLALLAVHLTSACGRATDAGGGAAAEARGAPA